MNDKQFISGHITADKNANPFPQRLEHSSRPTTVVMHLSKFMPSRRKPDTTTAESFSEASGVTISGGVHTVVGGVKMTIIDGDVDTMDVQEAGETVLREDSIIRKASLFHGAENVVLDGANIGRRSIKINGRERNPRK
jgi:hypothetical protein